MRVSVNSDACRGHGVCTAVCPDVFELTDDGYAEARVSEVPAGLEDEVREAVDNCPERAISTS